MENFLVSARKYRPATFDTVVGQGHITNTLKNAIKTGQLAQAFLFCGPRGVGKTTCARILAKTINCQNLRDDIEACDECESCKSFKQGGSFNIHELDAASNNSVDDIRSLVDQVRYAPQSGKKKIYIIDEVHMLSSSAFNAFLKTLEEPPPYAIFILATTEKHKIIPTILSRCQIFDFNRIQVNDIASHLAYIAQKENVSTEAQALHIIAQKADGALRDALSMFDQLVSFTGGNLSYKGVIDNLNILDYDYYFTLTDHLANADAAAALLLFDEILNNGFDGNPFIIGLAEHFRNLLVCKDPRSLGLLQASTDVQQRYSEQAKALSTSFILTALNIAGQCDIQYKQAKNQRLLVEMALIKMCHIGSAVQLAASGGASLSAEKKKPEPELKPETAAASIPATPAPTLTPTPPVVPAAAPALTPTLGSAQAPALTPTLSSAPAPTLTPTSGSSFKLPKLNDLENAYKTKKADSEEEAEIVNTAADEYTVSQLQSHWDEYLQRLAAEGKTNLHLLLAQQDITPQDNCIIVRIANKIQQEQLNAEKLDLMTFIRERLNNYTLDLQIIEDDRPDEGKTLYTASDKFKHLAQKNPALIDLKNKLDLDLEM